MSTGTGERARLWPTPVVGQTWIDSEGDDVTIIEVRPEGDWPVSFTQKGGSTGACARDMEDMKPTDETWLAHLLSTNAELRRVEGQVATLTRERDAANETANLTRDMFADAIELVQVAQRERDEARISTAGCDHCDYEDK